MASLRLEKVDKVYPNGQEAVRGIDLQIGDGELVVLVGPSGCGKTTILRIIAGLETPTRGRVFLDGKDVTDWPPQDRDLAMVFQSYSLYPHKTVRDNLGFGLRLRHAPRHVIADRVQSVARSLGLESLLDRRPGELSGGERQRVALGRAIVRRPRAFLLDEPLSNLDAQMRLQTRTELARLHRQLAATMLYVTHDQEEAMALGDRVAVLREGIVQQVAPPLDIESRPVNAFVAGFIGSPTMNFFPCHLRIEAGKTSLHCPWFQLAIDSIKAAHDNIGAAHAVSGGTSLTPCAAPNSPLTTHDSPHEILLGVRPYDLHVVDPSQADVVARVEAVERLGHQQVINAFLPPRPTLSPDGAGHGEGGETPVRILALAERGFAADDQVGIRLQRDRLHLFENATGRRLN